MAKVCWVIGVGPGIGAACMRRWVKGGFKVAVSARTEAKVAEFAKASDSVTGYASDVTDPESLAKTVQAIENDLGPIHTVIYNAGSGCFKKYKDVSMAEMEDCMRVNTFGLLSVAQLVGPKLEAAGDGVLAVTGATASWRGAPFTAAFAPAKAAQKMLAQALAKDVGPKGVHVFYAIIDGSVDPSSSNDSKIGADPIAQTYWDVAHQPKSCWTFEIEVRPSDQETWGARA